MALDIDLIEGSFDDDKDIRRLTQYARTAELIESVPALRRRSGIAVPMRVLEVVAAAHPEQLQLEREPSPMLLLNDPDGVIYPPAFYGGVTIVNLMAPKDKGSQSETLTRLVAALEKRKYTAQYKELKSGGAYAGSYVYQFGTPNKKRFNEIVGYFLGK